MYFLGEAQGSLAGPSLKKLFAGRSPAWVELDRGEAEFEPEPIERDQRGA